MSDQKGHSNAHEDHHSRFTLHPAFNPWIDKRLPQQLDHTHDITRFGVGHHDNLYPQRMNEIMLRSPLTKASVQTLADFITGDGWNNNGEDIANEDAQTWNDLLNLTAEDFSVFRGFALHLNFNGLGEVTEVQHIPFEYVRYGLPDETGRHVDVKVSNNWEQDSNTLPQGSILEPVEFPIFNPLTAQAETLTSGHGQVLYFTGNIDNYPLATFDSVSNAAQSDHDVQLFERNTVHNGFSGATLFKHPGPIESSREKAEFIAKAAQFTGPDAPGLWVVETDEDFTGDILESIPPNNNDTLYLNLTAHTRNTIIQAYRQPQSIRAIQPEGSVFTQQQIADGYLFYNLITKNFRSTFNRVFNSFGQLWHEGAIDFGEIKAQVFEAEVKEVKATNPESEPPPPAEEGETETETQVEARMNKIYV